MASEVKTNKISPAISTPVTLGDASDLFQLPASAEIDIASGATLDVNGTIDVTGATLTGSFGKVLQVVMGTSSTSVAQTLVAFTDTGLTVTITPSAATSKILILANHAVFYREGGTSIYLQLLRDASPIQNWGDGYLLFGGSGSQGSSSAFTYLDSPSSTSAIVYKTQFKSESAGGGIAVTAMAGNTDGSIIALEIGA